jgi:iron-sulfur cluster repair protein YtfE (RIC family)
MKITKDISIEELIESIPASVEYLMKEGIRCIVCGEPIWGSLEEAAEEKGFKAEDIERFVNDLQALADNKDAAVDAVEKKIDVKKMG